jgi:hypothetical protein
MRENRLQLGRGEFDAGVGDEDLFFFVEAAGGHFEGLFAHAEERVDVFGFGSVMIGEPAFVGLEEAEDLGGGVFGPFIAGFAGDHVDLCLA